MNLLFYVNNYHLFEKDSLLLLSLRKFSPSNIFLKPGVPRTHICTTANTKDLSAEATSEIIHYLLLCILVGVQIQHNCLYELSHTNDAPVYQGRIMIQLLFEPPQSSSQVDCPTTQTRYVRMRPNSVVFHN